MKALVLNSLGQRFELEDIDIARPIGREVLIDMQASGLCHTDLLFARHEALGCSDECERDRSERARCRAAPRMVCVGCKTQWRAAESDARVATMVGRALREPAAHVDEYA